MTQTGDACAIVLWHGWTWMPVGPVYPQTYHVQYEVQHCGHWRTADIRYSEGSPSGKASESRDPVSNIARGDCIPNLKASSQHSHLTYDREKCTCTMAPSLSPGMPALKNPRLTGMGTTRRWWRVHGRSIWPALCRNWNLHQYPDTERVHQVAR